MRKVAAYSLECKSIDADSAAILYAEISEKFDAWLSAKGKLDSQGKAFIFAGGKKGELSDIAESASGCDLRSIALSEETEGGAFFCEIGFARKGEVCAIFVELRAASGVQKIAPFQYDVRRPGFISEILAGKGDWYLGENLLVDRPYVFSGTEEAIRLVKLIWHPERTVPLVLISIEEGRAFAEKFVDNVASDLSGLAIVATLDEPASRALSGIKGMEWSCYNGAVRIYWPITVGVNKPDSHPLWTKGTIYKGIADPRDAARRMRSQLRRQILGLSAFSVREPRILRDVKNEFRAIRYKGLDNALRASQDSSDFKEIAESYAKENDALRNDLAKKEERLSELEDQVENLQVALRFASVEESSIAPDAGALIETVRDALNSARQRYGGQLEFSDSVDDDAKGLHPKAGPPEKIMKYLQSLAELSDSLRSGSLGAGVIPWLENQGVACSVESETTRSSKVQMRRRTWSFSGVPSEFDYHLKPSDGVSPDRCVPIYFDLKGRAGKVRIGYLGRHID